MPGRRRQESAMSRPSALLLVALAAVAASGAPAPLPKPPLDWVRGWDRPVCFGRCRFEGKGGRLTMTLPRTAGDQTAAYLLRDVEGDFVAQLRVSGTFRPSP